MCDFGKAQSSGAPSIQTGNTDRLSIFAVFSGFQALQLNTDAGALDQLSQRPPRRRYASLTETVENTAFAKRGGEQGRRAKKDA